VPPTGPDWIHEIKHDGFRMVAHRDARGRVGLVSSNGYDFADRFPLAAAAVAALPARSCVVDGEAIACAMVESNAPAAPSQRHNPPPT